MNKPHQPLITSFESLSLSAKTMQAIKKMGYTQSTPIQAAAIPLLLKRQSVMAIAQTGTGKTGAFCIPTVELLAQERGRPPMPRCLMLAPTRELAVQIQQQLDQLCAPHGLSTVLMIGGGSVAQLEQALLKNIDIIIATPGRFMDMYQRGRLLLNDCKLLIIDEADRMLDMGFIPDIEKIMAWLPADRTTAMFSATFPPPIKKLVHRFMAGYQEVAVSPASTTAATIEQLFLAVNASDKAECVAALLEAHDMHGVMVFCNTKRGVDQLTRDLKRMNMKVAAIHGDLSQAARDIALAQFKKGKLAALIASDVAARGIDIKDVPAVINFDLHADTDTYVHRIGRTGRAGQEGVAITLLTAHDGEKLADLKKAIKMDVHWHEFSDRDIEDILLADAPKKSAGKSPAKKHTGKKAPPQHRERDDKPRQARNQRDPDAHHDTKPARKSAAAPAKSRSLSAESALPSDHDDDMPAFLKPAAKGKR